MRTHIFDPKNPTNLALCRSLLILVVAVLSLGLAIGEASAQANSVRNQLERTDAIMQEAAEIVRQAIGERPKDLLREARDVQLRAWDEFRANNLGAAALISAQARQLSVRAAELARAELRVIDDVRQMLTENRELVERARERLHDSTNAEARRLLEAGLNEIERGQRAFADREFRQAVRFSMFGRDLLHRAIRAAEGDGATSLDRVREELTATDEFLREAEVAVGDDERARVWLDEATTVQRQARELFENGRERQARRLTLRSREQVVTLLRGLGAPDRGLEHKIERAEQRFRDLRERAAGSDDRRVSRLLDEAGEHLREAADAASSDRRKDALANLQLLANLLNRVAELLP